MKTSTETGSEISVPTFFFRLRAFSTNQLHRSSMSLYLFTSFFINDVIPNIPFRRRSRLLSLSHRCQKAITERDQCLLALFSKQVVGGRPPRYAPAPLLPVDAEAPPPPSRRQRSSSFPLPTRSHAHCCSRLTRQHGGEQSGLVTSTFDLLAIKAVSEWCQYWSPFASLFST